MKNYIVESYEYSRSGYGVGTGYLIREWEPKEGKSSAYYFFKWVANEIHKYFFGASDNKLEEIYLDGVRYRHENPEDILASVFKFTGEDGRTWNFYFSDVNAA